MLGPVCIILAPHGPRDEKEEDHVAEVRIIVVIGTAPVKVTRQNSRERELLGLQIGRFGNIGDD